MQSNSSFFCIILDFRDKLRTTKILSSEEHHHGQIGRLSRGIENGVTSAGLWDCRSIRCGAGWLVDNHISCQQIVNFGSQDHRARIFKAIVTEHRGHHVGEISPMSRENNAITCIDMLSTYPVIESCFYSCAG